MIGGIILDSSFDSLEYEEDLPHAIEIIDSRNTEYYEEVFVREILEEQTREDRCRAKCCHTICLGIVCSVFIFLAIYIPLKKV